MGRTSELRGELKRRFFPHVQQNGFVLHEKEAPNLWRFLRRAGPVVQTFEIQWEKYGRPRFVINFGTCPAEGMNINGKQFIPEDIFVGWLDRHGRLQPVRGSSVGAWFRQDKGFLASLFSSEKLVPAEDVVSQLMGLFPEVEEYWARGSVGPHLNMFDRGAASTPLI